MKRLARRPTPDNTAKKIYIVVIAFAYALLTT
jgi:hypothetical protein